MGEDLRLGGGGGESGKRQGVAVTEARGDLEDPGKKGSPGG